MRAIWMAAALAVATPAFAEGLDGGDPDAAAPARFVDAGLAPDPGGTLEPPRTAPAEVPAAAAAEPARLPAQAEAAEPAPMAPMASTQIGGYAELTYNRPSDGVPVLDFRRFVLMVGHSFDPHWRIYSELEVEHAVASSEDQGEVEVEQAYVEYLHREWLNVRAGLVLMPVGIINQQHEPPTFNGVDRPLVDELVIPSTWREPAVGVWGRFAEDFRYQLYLVDGMRAVGFNVEGIREGHQEAQLARARSAALVGRLDWQPLNALELGGSAYYGSANQGELPDGAGKLLLGELDARYEHQGFEARAEAAMLHISGTEFMATEAESGAAAAPVGSLQYGLYVDVGYDLMHLWKPGSGTRLVLYGEYQRADTNFEVAPERVAEDAAEIQVLEAGLTWRPISEVVFKGDLRREQHPLVDGQDRTWIDLGIGWMF